MLEREEEEETAKATAVAAAAAAAAAVPAPAAQEKPTSIAKPFDAAVAEPVPVAVEEEQQPVVRKPTPIVKPSEEAAAEPVPVGAEQPVAAPPAPAKVAGSEVAAASELEDLLPEAPTGAVVVDGAPEAVRRASVGKELEGEEEEESAGPLLVPA